MNRLNTLLHETGLHPSLLVDFAIDARSAVASRDRAAFWMACVRLIDGKFDETLIVVIALAASGWVWVDPDASGFITAGLLFAMFRAFAYSRIAAQ